MRRILTTLALMALAALPASSQAVGDSVRLRVPPSSAWAHGHLVSLDSIQLTVGQAQGNQSYALQGIGRAEVWRRKNAGGTVLASTIACMAGAGLGIALRSDHRGALTGSTGGDLALAAGVGAAIGLIDLSVRPGRWTRLRSA